jgi:Co/Zn/Cd efflux system component
MAVAVLGLLVNLASAALLGHGHDHDHDHDHDHGHTTTITTTISARPISTSWPTR